MNSVLLNRAKERQFVFIYSGWQARRMTTIAATASQVFPVFAQGLVLSLGLIVAIGAQNAFVLRQGLRREHVGSVVLFCALADAVLITAGVLGMAQALGQNPGLARAMALAGAASLGWFSALGFGARWIAPLFKKPRAWQVLDALIGLTMWVLSALLVRLALQGARGGSMYLAPHHP